MKSTDRKYRAMLRRLEKAVGAGKVDAPARLGVSQEWWSDVLAGQTFVHVFDLDLIAEQLQIPREYLLHGGRLTPAWPTIQSVGDAVRAANTKLPEDSKTFTKKNWSEAFSRGLAILFANSLRPTFPGITPTTSGRQQEKPARSVKGFKKLDVGYSTAELGLALGLSIKTINFRDPTSGRYTKNYSRVDNELRAEATDYHRRQPYAILIGVLLIPRESCFDAAAGKNDEAGISSFGAAVQFFRDRTGRMPPADDADLFELFYVGIYDKTGDADDAVYWNVNSPPPKTGLPTLLRHALDAAKVIEEICNKYEEVNRPAVRWYSD